MNIIIFSRRFWRLRSRNLQFRLLKYSELYDRYALPAADTQQRNNISIINRSTLVDKMWKKIYQHIQLAQNHLTIAFIERTNQD